jgi:hypothetical protein
MLFLRCREYDFFFEEAFLSGFKLNHNDVFQTRVLERSLGVSLDIKTMDPFRPQFL